MSIPVSILMSQRSMHVPQHTSLNTPVTCLYTWLHTCSVEGNAYVLSHVRKHVYIYAYIYTEAYVSTNGVGRAYRSDCTCKCRRAYTNVCLNTCSYTWLHVHLGDGRIGAHGPQSHMHHSITSPYELAYTQVCAHTSVHMPAHMPARTSTRKLVNMHAPMSVSKLWLGSRAESGCHAHMSASTVCPWACL